MTDTTSPPVAGSDLPVATLIAGCLAQTGLAIPATLNGFFQTDLETTGSQLTWISDAALLPVAVLGLTFGVFGDLFGRKRLLIGGVLLMAAGEAARPRRAASTSCGPARRPAASAPRRSSPAPSP